MNKRFSILSTALLGGFIAASTAGSAQLSVTNVVKADVKADPAAVALLTEAHDKRDNFAPGFSGVTANVTVNDNGKEAKGTLIYTSAGELKITLNSATKEQETWAKEQLGSAFSHRRPDDFAHGDGGRPLTFVGEETPLGKQISLNDKMNSLYRVKDGHITQVTRSMGPTMRFTITVLADRNLPGGKYLPSQFTVTYFDATSGAIKSVDFFSDKFTKVGDSWVPSARRVVTAENGNFVTRSFTLEEIKAN